MEDPCPPVVHPCCQESKPTAPDKSGKPPGTPILQAVDPFASMPELRDLEGFPCSSPKTRLQKAPEEAGNSARMTVGEGGAQGSQGM